MTARGRDLTAAGSSALLLCLAFPPFNLGVPSFVCMVPVVVALEHHVERRESVARDVVLGAWFGLLANAGLLHWMAIAVWHYNHRLILGVVAGLLWLAMATGCAFGAIGWIRRRSGTSVMVVFPVVWTALEWLLAHQPVAPFTWLGLGTSLTGYPLMVQVAELMGARGVTFLLATANAAIAVAWIRRELPSRARIPLAAAGLGVVSALGYGIVRTNTLEQHRMMNVMAVQTNIAARDKWAPGRSGEMEAEVLRLSRSAAARQIDLIAWPETALPGALMYHPDWRDDVRALARERAAYVMVGTIDAVVIDGGLDQYNAALLMGPSGREQGGMYRKRELVPFFERWNGVSGGDEGAIFATARGKVGVLICDEASFEQLSRDYRRRGASALVNLANDAWFAAGAGPAQHAAHLVMRAIETRMGIVRAVNAGISEFVDPTGRVQRRLPGNSAGVLEGSLMLSPTVPLYVRLGDWVGALAVAACVFLMVVAMCVTYRRWMAQ